MFLSFTHLQKEVGTFAGQLFAKAWSLHIAMIQSLTIYCIFLASCCAGEDKRDNGECFLGWHNGIYERG